MINDGKEAAGRVCDEGAALAVTSMDAGGEKKHVKVRHVAGDNCEDTQGGRQ